MAALQEIGVGLIGCGSMGQEHARNLRPLPGIFPDYPAPIVSNRRNPHNTEVGVIHSKAMPVILTSREEIDLWMTAPTEDARRAQAATAACRRCSRDRRAG